MVYTKKVKSKADLNELALETGASVVDTGGQQFNVEKKQASKARRLEKNPDARQIPIPEPIPEPVKADPGMALLAEKIENTGKEMVNILSELKQQISKIRLQVDHPILDWDFEVLRDNKGYLTNIIAHATVVKPTLN